MNTLYHCLIKTNMSVILICKTTDPRLQLFFKATKNKLKENREKRKNKIKERSYETKKNKQKNINDASNIPNTSALKHLKFFPQNQTQSFLKFTA